MLCCFITCASVFLLTHSRYACGSFSFHHSCFFAQFFGYHLTGKFIDFQQLTNLISRTHLCRCKAYGKNTSYFRPVGFNSEPHSYCVSVALLTLHSQRQSMRFCHHVGALCHAKFVSMGLLIWPCLTCAIIAIQEPKLRRFLCKFSKSAVIALWDL